MNAIYARPVKHPSAISASWFLPKLTTERDIWCPFLWMCSCGCFWHMKTNTLQKNFTKTELAACSCGKQATNFGDIPLCRTAKRKTQNFVVEKMQQNMAKAEGPWVRANPLPVLTRNRKSLRRFCFPDFGSPFRERFAGEWPFLAASCLFFFSLNSEPQSFSTFLSVQLCSPGHKRESELNLIWLHNHWVLSFYTTKWSKNMAFWLFLLWKET